MCGPFQPGGGFVRTPRTPPGYAPDIWPVPTCIVNTFSHIDKRKKQALPVMFDVRKKTRFSLQLYSKK